MYFESKTNFADEPVLDAPNYDEGIDMIEDHIEELKQVRSILRVWQTIMFGSGVGMLISILLFADPTVSIIIRLGVGGALFGMIWGMYVALIIIASNEIRKRKFLLVPIRAIRQLTARIYAWEVEYARQNAPDAQMG